MPFLGILSGVLCLLMASVVHAATGEPTVNVLNGTYVGYHLPQVDQDVFLGMPYTQPPLGHLRFREVWKTPFQLEQGGRI